MADGVDAVIHMAASSLVGESMTDPGKYYRNNVVASLGLLDAMRASGVRSIVFSSTAAVYGNPARHPISEGDPTHPSNTYGETKLAIEKALHWCSRAYGTRYVALRYFNAAGATQLRGERHDPETHLIPLVLAAAGDEGPAVTVFGNDYPTRDGTCVRDYVHVSDLAQAHVAAVDALVEERIQEEVFNLGCGGGFTVKEVIDTAELVTGRKIRVRNGPRREGDPAVLIASSEKIRAALGWSPRQGSLEDIIGSAWAWHEHLAIEVT
jgi:UDP-glucose 4-epimerase